MTEYECKRCGYSTKIRKIYHNHIIKKNVCKPKISTIERSILVQELEEYIKNGSKGGLKSKMNPNESKMNPNESKMNPNESNNMIQSEYAMNLVAKHTCDRCLRGFSTNSNLNKHRNRSCLAYKESENEIKILKEEIKALKNNKCNKVSHISNINNGTANINNNTNNTNNTNIHIHAYGKEDFSYIDKQTLLLAHRAPFISVPHLVTRMFFNDEHPENQNVKWKNKKINYMQRLENGENGPEWVNRDKNEVIRDLNDRAYNKIDYEYNSNTSGNSEYQKNHYECFVVKYDSQDKVTMRRLVKETERLILNTRLVS
jgi:hypothetical protein